MLLRYATIRDIAEGSIAMSLRLRHTILMATTFRHIEMRHKSASAMKR